MYKNHTIPARGAEKRPFKPDVIESYVVDSASQLLEFLIAAMPERKRTAIKSLLAHNQVAVNGTPQRQFDFSLKHGDEVKVNLSREFRTFYNRRLKLVYEDDDIIVVNKGYGLLSMGNEKVKDETAYNILRDYLKWQDPRNKVFIVHRLDRDTSGLMVFAKTVEAKEKLQHNWNNMVLERKYLAVVEGRPDPSEGEVRSYLAENSRYEVYSTDNPEGGTTGRDPLSHTQEQTRIFAHGGTARHGPQKPDTRAHERPRPPHHGRPPLRSRLLSHPPYGPACSDPALCPPHHAQGHEFLNSIPISFGKIVGM